MEGDEIPFALYISTMHHNQSNFQQRRFIPRSQSPSLEQLPLYSNESSEAGILTCIQASSRLDTPRIPCSHDPPRLAGQIEAARIARAPTLPQGRALRDGIDGLMADG